MQQRSLFSKAQLGRAATSEHGGDVGCGCRKVARPISTRRPMHLVLRSSRAIGAWSLRRPKTEVGIRMTIRTLARRYGVRVYELANACNHVHLVVRTRSRPGFHAFLRAFAGIV